MTLVQTHNTSYQVEALQTIAVKGEWLYLNFYVHMLVRFGLFVERLFHFLRFFKFDISKPEKQVDQV